MGEGVSLAGFLLERIAEDEQWARYAGEAQDAERRTGLAFISSIATTSVTSAGRVLAECAAKRAIVEAHTYMEGHRSRDFGFENGNCLECRKQGPCPTLRHLAAVYADHDDYRDEWKP